MPERQQPDPQQTEPKQPDPEQHDPEQHDWGDALPRLQARRLSLRPLTSNDVPDLYEIFSDPEVTRYWSSPPYTEMAQAEALLAEIEESFLQRTLFQWGVEREADGKVVGTVTLWQLDIGNRRGESGFALGREAWGQGLMTEALGALFAFCFGVLGLHRLEADVEPANERSLALLERLGFRREGVLRERWFTYGEWQDSVMLGLLAEEWGG